FFLNWQNGVNYNLTALSPQYDMQSLQDLRNIPISATGGKGSQILGNYANVERGTEMQVVSHFNINRVIDIYASVQDRDLGAVSGDINRVIDQNRSKLPRGSFISVAGQVDTMRAS